MSETTNHLNHSTWECKYHVVFTPKYRKKGLWSPDDGALFFPMEFTSAQSVPEIHEMPVCSDPVPVELRLSNGRCLRFDNRLDAAMLTQLIRAVEAA